MQEVWTLLARLQQVEPAKLADAIETLHRRRQASEASGAQRSVRQVLDARRARLQQESSFLDAALGHAPERSLQPTKEVFLSGRAGQRAVGRLRVNARPDAQLRFRPGRDGLGNQPVVTCTLLSKDDDLQRFQLEVDLQHARPGKPFDFPIDVQAGERLFARLWVNVEAT